MNTVDVLVVGGGIAGLSAAAALAPTRSVVVLEAEEANGIHATGRSAASLGRGYGNAAVRRLTELAAPFFEEPPPGFAEAPLLRPRPWVMIARDDQHASLQTMLAQVPGLRALDEVALSRLLPLLREGYATAGAVDDRSADVDVDALLQGFLRQLKSLGGQAIVNATVTAPRYEAGLWRVEVGGETHAAPVLINAAGAWADQVAVAAGVRPLGLAPLKRTAILVDGPAGIDIADMPLVMDVDEAFYFKPEAGKLLVSPADETPTDPCDAQADEYEVALAAHLLETATRVTVRRVGHRWAGLRTFAADRTPVAGFDPDAPGFLWLAGQGGYGVQTAPAMAAIAASLVNGEVRADVDEAFLAALSPARFGRSGGPLCEVEKANAVSDSTDRDRRETALP